MRTNLGGRLPTHAEVTDFLSQYLPHQINAHDVPYLFHTPRHPQYAASKQRLRRLILSVTPTAGFYAAFNEPEQHPPPVGFLHRPWTLNRRSVPRGSLVLASHQAFDANLTVGWNTALAERLGLNVNEAVCIKGYKGDEERKIGLVANLKTPVAIRTLVQNVKAEFDGLGDFFFDNHDQQQVENDANSMVNAVAIMNAFHKEEVDRALAAVHDAGWIPTSYQGNQLLYLTGAARSHGLEAAAAIDMPVLCVGHRACEEWGIRYLAREVRQQWPSLDVVEILEEEEEREQRPPTAAKESSVRPVVSSPEQSYSDRI